VDTPEVISVNFLSGPDRGQNAVNILIQVALLLSELFSMLTGLFGGLLG
ncbi:MAG: hypothetical protein GX851_07800, partial [Clostridiales bacterium]|nr:hypothetical protein [Clostridiales bacterium]